MIPAECQSVKTANGPQMLIEGVATVNSTVFKRNVRHEIHIAPDLIGLIFRSDWMVKQGRLVWNYTNNQVRFGDSNEWIALHREIDTRRVPCSHFDRRHRHPFVLFEKAADPFLMKESLKLSKCRTCATSIAKGASYPLSSPSYEFESLMLILASKFSGKKHGSVSWKELKSLR